MSDQERISTVEKEVKHLKIKLEALVTCLKLSQLAPPNGIELYDSMVQEALTKEGL
jgi:hypothetical protein